MDLKENDLHFVFSKQARTCRAFDASGRLVFECEARNKTTNEGSFGHNGNLPFPGEYVFGKPIPKTTPPFGPWFVPIIDAPGHNELASRGRAGLGWHGGGSGLPNPMASHQSPPFVVTHGCERSINADICKGVLMIHATQALGGTCYVTNAAPLPGADEESADDYTDIDEKDIDPDE